MDFGKTRDGQIFNDKTCDGFSRGVYVPFLEIRIYPYYLFKAS